MTRNYGSLIFLCFLIFPTRCEFLFAIIPRTKLGISDERKTMNFIVTYRGTDGALRTQDVEAANRTECMEKCRQRGIMPMTLKEGGAARTTPRHKGREGLRSFRGVQWKAAIFMAIVLAAIGSVWWLTRRDDEKASQQKRIVKSEKAPMMHKENINSPQTAETHEETKGIQNDKDSKEHNVPEVPKAEIISVQTNKSGYVVERVRNPDGTTSKRVHSPPPIFKHASDQMIAMVLSAPPGQAIPPMPANAFTDEDFKNSLQEEIEILDTDSPAVKDMKARVIVAREDIRAMMKQGYSALQVLEEHQALFNDNAKLHADALVEMKSILASGDREAARKYATTVNVAFRQMGVPELTVPSKDGVQEAESRSDRLNAIREKAKQRKDQKK